MKTLWDISPPVHAGAPVFPGDTAYAQQWVASIGPGCPVNVSAITLSPHVGSHADAPLHYDPSGASIGEVPLETFIGTCRVIHAVGVGPLVKLEHLDGHEVLLVSEAARAAYPRSPSAGTARRP